MGTVIDASALIAFLRDEPGADVVENVLPGPEKCYAHALNLCEVYYDFFRASNQDAAEAAISDLLGLAIEERTDMDAEFWRDVGASKLYTVGFPSRTAAPWRWRAAWVPA